MDVDGSIDSDRDPDGKMLDILEKANHGYVEDLVQLDWDLAVDMKRLAPRVLPTVTGTDGRQQVTCTVHGTCEHQDLLMKYVYAGVFY